MVYTRFDHDYYSLPYGFKLDSFQTVAQVIWVLSGSERSPAIGLSRADGSCLGVGIAVHRAECCPYCYARTSGLSQQCHL
jgi:hypothetical protein